ncbi:MAG: GNVR domain-containing protein, partial [Deltaproteobacteria bacterium]
EANLRTLDRFQMELQTTAIELRNAEERKAILEAQPALTNTAGLDVALAPETELDRLQSDLARLLSVYKENYPDVVITRKRIADIKELLAESNKDVNRAGEAAGADAAARNPQAHNALAADNSQITALKQRMSDIKKQIALYEKRVEETPAMEQRFTNLRRDYDISLKNYQDLLAKKLSARLAENLEKRQKGERFRVLDSANLPERSIKPNKPLITLIGFLAGLGGGCALVYVFEFISPSFRKREDVEAALGQPVLAVIPIFLDKHNHKRVDM